MVGYIFGGETGDTPESLKRKRDIAAAMMARSSTPKNVGEGLGAIGNAIVYRAMMNGVEKGEAAGRKSADESFAPIASLLGGGSQAPSAVPMTGAASEVSGTVPSAGNPDIAATESYIREAATKRGIDPEVAVKVARSEGLAPGVWQSNVVRGDGKRETSYGPFQLLVGGGLGDKFQKVYGKSPSDPSTLNQQIDFALDEAASGGWSPWYGAAKVGVGARTGLDRARALGYQPQQGGQQVASLDPAAGMAQRSQPLNEIPTLDNASPVSKPQFLDTQPPAPPLPPPTTVASPPPVAAQAPAAQVAQAMSSQQPSSIDLGAVTKALNNPFLSPGQRAVAQSILQQEMDRRNTQYEQQLKQSDPKYRQELEKGSLELENLKNPKMSPAEQATDARDREKMAFERQKFEEEVKKGQWEKMTDGRLYNKTTGDFKDAPPPVPGSTPPKFDDISGVRKEIQQLPAYKNLAQAAPIYKSMVETAGRSSKASDLNLVYGLGKIMDPTSVVREGEMVMVKNTASIPDWFQGVIASLNGGAALTPETRQAIMKEAYGRVQGYSDEFGRNIEQYKGIAQRNNMNEADIIPPIDKFEPWTAPPQDGAPTAQPAPEGAQPTPAATARPQTQADFDSLKPGELYIDPDDGKTYRKN